MKANPDKYLHNETTSLMRKLREDLKVPFDCHDSTAFPLSSYAPATMCFNGLRNDFTVQTSRRRLFRGTDGRQCRSTGGGYFAERVAVVSQYGWRLRFSTGGGYLRALIQSTDGGVWCDGED
eukprot:1275511-Rhodomonas_salina.2